MSKRVDLNHVTHEICVKILGSENLGDMLQPGSHTWIEINKDRMPETMKHVSI